VGSDQVPQAVEVFRLDNKSSVGFHFLGEY
jgi:hypothetical protein